MKLRIPTLWKVPVFCMLAGWATFWLTAYLGQYFFVVQETGADGIIHVSADPVRSALFSGVLFLAVLLIGGLGAFRAMTRKEIALAAAIATGIFLLLDCMQLLFPNYSSSLFFAYIQHWVSIPAVLLHSITGSQTFAAIVSSFAPLLFIPFGKNPKKDDDSV